MSEVEQRWAKEQEFFDAEEYAEGPIPPSTIERYMSCGKPFTPAEYPFWLLGDVRGKRILEVGCGDGCNAILMALKGASVVGVDISPRAIEVATKRSAIHGVDDRVKFHALPLESYLARAEGPYDLICGFAFLHHVIPVLDSVLSNLKQLANGNTGFLFTEPVSLSRSLRRLRLALPLKVQGTEDERPLEQAELAIIRRHLPGLEVRLLQVLERWWVRFLPRRYEDFSPLQRDLYDSVCRVDRFVLSLPALSRLGSHAVLYAGLPGQPSPEDKTARFKLSPS